MQACSDIAVTVPTISEENQLIIPESTESLTLADFVPVLNQYREVNASLVFNYREKKGNAEARSHVAKLRRIKAPIADIHKRMKAEYKAIVDKMDADKRNALKVVEEMIDHHDKHIRAVAEEEAAEALRKKIESEIDDCWDMAHEMNNLFDQKREVERKTAEQARIAAEQADAQRKIEQAAREKEIAETAAAAAKEKAEAEMARKVKEAEERAAAATRVEEERRRQAEERAAADVENTRRVHRAILAVMVESHGIDEETAKGLILAIRGREIPALSIDYQWR